MQSSKNNNPFAKLVKSNGDNMMHKNEAHPLFKKAHTLVRSIANTTTNHGHYILDKLIPPRCAITGDIVDNPAQLSAHGWSNIHFIEPPYCCGCSLPFSVDHGENIKCANCLSDHQDFDTARCAVVYDDASHPLIGAFKHGDRTELAPLFTGWLARIAGDVLTPNSILIPVPLHKHRLISRRYNQSALLAHGLSQHTGAAIFLNAIERHRPTIPQQDLSAAGRERNVSGAFRMVHKSAQQVKNAHIILIDDVLTTGSTLSACARVLYKAGASRVDALVLARVVNTGGQAI